MKIAFDNKAKIAGIGLVPWPRLGPERWFTNYRIASLHGWDIAGIPHIPQVTALADRMERLPRLAKMNTQNLLEDVDFQSMLQREFEGYDFMTYKAVCPPAELARISGRFLYSSRDLAAKLENKAAFRTMFQSDLPFPEYAIIERSMCTPDAAGLTTILAGQRTVVVQDESLSGGKGTFIVRSLTDLQQALTALDKIAGRARSLVVSTYIESAHERSLQCVVTRYGVFVGPLQTQIVRNPLLSNLEVVEGDRFCGGEISDSDPLQGVYPTMHTYAMLIGKRLQGMGYRGIFGIDCLVTDEGRVYVLEINPRLTGMTPLLTMLYREEQDVPFYLLHILELADIPYRILDNTFDQVPPIGSLLLLHSQMTVPTVINTFPPSGIYDMNGNFLQKAFRLDMSDPSAHVLLQQYQSPTTRIMPGGRLASLFTNIPVLDKEERLAPAATELIRCLLGKVELQV